MRPINLIPPEERRAHGGAPRTGPLVYILVGSLAVLLIGVVMLVLTSNQISDHESEIEKLNAEKATATAKVAALAPYTSFQQLASQRIKAVGELANGRFDWSRVVRQLSLVIPSGIVLSEAHASADGENESQLRVTSPSLTLVGCSPSQDTVAELIASLKQIDGVTRVGLAQSKLAETGESEGEAPVCDGFNFELTAAFDAAPLTPDAASGEVVAPAPEAAAEAPSEAPEPSEEATSESSTEPEPSSEGAVSSAGTDRETG